MARWLNTIAVKTPTMYMCTSRSTLAPDAMTMMTAKTATMNTDPRCTSLSFLIAICRGRTPSDASRPVSREKRLKTEVAAAYRIATAEKPDDPRHHAVVEHPHRDLQEHRPVGPAREPVCPREPRHSVEGARAGNDGDEQGA